MVWDKWPHRGPHVLRWKDTPLPEECELLNAGSWSGHRDTHWSRAKEHPVSPKQGHPSPREAIRTGCAASLPRRGSVQGQGRFVCGRAGGEGWTEGPSQQECAESRARQPDPTASLCLTAFIGTVACLPFFFFLVKLFCLNVFCNAFSFKIIIKLNHMGFAFKN